MISKLRKLLLNSDKPQYLVAGEIGLHPSTLSLYALGRKAIAPHHLVLMTRYWQCEPEDILGYLDEDDIINWMEDAELKESV